MKNTLMIRVVGVLLVIFGLQVASTSKASAEVWICFHGTDCYWGEGKCDGWCPDPPASPTCEDCGPMAYAKTDYILAQNNHVWLVQGSKRIPMVSDEFEAFIKQMKRKYSVKGRKDPKVSKLISSEFASFRKERDTGRVSKSRLDQIAKSSKLRVVYKDTTYGISQPGVK